MKVLVTGGTGYLGSHIVAALVAAGHTPRLLARRPAQVPITLAPHGIQVEDVVEGDVTDADAVRSAVDGCDAVVHAAAIFSLDPRRAEEMGRTNVAAAENVLGAAVAADCTSIVHVSSTVALVRQGGTNGELPLGDVDLPYSQSKIDSERLARRLQDERAPLTIVYPGAVHGPHDPYMGNQATRLAWIVRGLFPIWPRGGLHAVDVRDVAAVVAASLAPGRRTRRFVVPGHHMTGDDIYGAVEKAIGRRRPFVSLPAGPVRAVSRTIESIQGHLPARFYMPADREATELALRDTQFDTTPARVELGVTPRPFDESIRDTITWLVDAGHLPERYRPLESTTIDA
jgi:nucleoside-diphosphate-sugar epimerase